MKHRTLFVLAAPFFNTFDGEDDNVPPVDGGTPPASSTPPPASSTPPPASTPPNALTMTQEDLQKEINKALSAKQKEYDETHKNLMQEMEMLKTRSNMNATERKEHETRVKELEEKLLTTEELAKREQQKIKAQREKETSELSQERDYWSGLYHKERIIRGITDAATAHKAVSPEQMVAMLRGSTKLVERETEEGEKIYDVMVSLPEKDDDGKEITLQLEVSKALEHMSQQQKYFNLFTPAIKSGFNGAASTGGSGGQPSEDELAKDPRKWRDHSRRKRGIIK